MKLGNDVIKNKFDDIEIKVDFLIELCQTLQAENLELRSKIDDLEIDLTRKNEAQELNAEQEALIQAKIDGLLIKLDSFSIDLSNDESKKEPQSNV